VLNAPAAFAGAISGVQPLSTSMLAGRPFPTASRSSDGLLRDSAVIVEGLGSLLPPPDALGGCEVLLPAGAMCCHLQAFFGMVI
jgi:hypothetical protein